MHHNESEEPGRTPGFFMSDTPRERAIHTRHVTPRVIFNTAMVNIAAFRLCLLLVAGIQSRDGLGQSTRPVELHLYRPKKALGCALNASVFINDTVVVRLRNNEHQVILLPAGPCRLTTRKNALTLTLESGEPAFIRVGYDLNFLFGKLEAVEVTKAFAKAEIDRIEADQ
jgi:hypothetical protein